MTSFQRKRKVLNIAGCKPSLQNGQIIVSTGNPSLDNIIGGGLPIGTTLLIEEDKHNNYSKVLTKYFLAEGIVRNHSLFVASLDDDSKEFIKKIPTVANSRDGDKKVVKTNDIPEDMRIAFRYNALPKVDSEQTTTSSYYFDLTKQVDEEVLKNNTIFHWNGISNDDNTESNIKFFNPNFNDLLNKIYKQMKSETFATNNDEGDKNLLRISISSLGSPLWYDDNFSKDLKLFLFILKAVIRSTLAICMLTIPMHLLKHLDKKLLTEIRDIVDYSIHIESFAGSSKETNPAFKEYHGLLHIKKLSAVNTLAPFSPETYDLAFKLRRKKFVIEKLHLPPDLQEVDGPSKTMMPSMSCASTTTKNLLDF